jgi:DNA helicase-2/ATP-dependent DNA helicase PcrA
LLRDSHQSIAIENALITAGISYHCHALEPYLQRPEILFLRGLLAIALEDLAKVMSKDIRKAIVEALVTFGELDLKTALYLPGVGTPASDKEALSWAQQTVAESPDSLQSFFTGLIVGKEDEKLTPARQRIVACVDYLRGLGDKAPAAEVFLEVWARLDLAAAIKRLYVYPDEAAIVIRSAQGFIELARHGSLTLADLSASIGKREATVGKSHGKKRVTVERVATSKGKEYTHVILPFLEQGEFPLAGAAFADESNLFYVGATRAKARLTLISPPEPEQQSVFIKSMRLGSALAAKAEEARKKLAEAQEAAAINAVSKKLSFSRFASVRTDLKVGYADKDQAKSLGARWDATRKTWYIEEGMELALFRAWLGG